jgi:CelD/BcsL family acetyltransferase involved in cellulose biosynthesis
MDFTITRESFDRLTEYWSDSDNGLKWGSIFVLPQWLEVWWQSFQPEGEPYITVIRQRQDVIGIAPLRVKGKQARFIGSPDVCDYQDFIIIPGREADFSAALLDYLGQQSITDLYLGPVRPDSAVVTALTPLAEERGYEMRKQQDEVTLELELPATWEEYLSGLDKKQRHEVRRKLRRLWETDSVTYKCHKAGAAEAGDLTDAFLKLFALSREEKADFMTEQMQSFFQSLAETMAEMELLRFGILAVDEKPAAMIMGFDYQQSMYLYNSAYDPQYNSLSVGVLSKILCIKESINRGLKKWDFLKGAERYKYHLGGSEVQLFDYQIVLK